MIPSSVMPQKTKREARSLNQLRSAEIMIEMMTMSRMS